VPVRWSRQVAEGLGR